MAVPLEESGQDKRADADDLDGQVDNDQVLGGGHQEQAEHDRQQEQVIFVPGGFKELTGIWCYKENDRSGDQKEPLEEPAVRIHRQGAEENGLPGIGLDPQQCSGDRQGRQRQQPHHPVAVRRPHKHINQDDHHHGSG